MTPPCPAYCPGCRGVSDYAALWPAGCPGCRLPWQALPYAQAALPGWEPPRPVYPPFHPWPPARPVLVQAALWEAPA